MPKRLIITVVCFHVTAALLALAGLAVLVFFAVMGMLGGAVSDAARQMPGHGIPANPDIGGMMSSIFALLAAYAGIFGLGFLAVAVGVEVVVWGLKKLEYWAWVVGIVICGMLIVSVFSGALFNPVLGGLGLWGLVDRDSVAAFKSEEKSSLYMR